VSERKPCVLLAVFFARLAGVVPPRATAPALIVVGYLIIGIGVYFAALWLQRLPRP
jgi:xanthine/uracil/vitamin C permease (AzgA family)